MKSKTKKTAKKLSVPKKMAVKKPISKKKIGAKNVAAKKVVSLKATKRRSVKLIKTDKRIGVLAIAAGLVLILVFVYFATSDSYLGFGDNNQSVLGASYSGRIVPTIKSLSIKNPTIRVAEVNNDSAMLEFEYSKSGLIPGMSGKVDSYRLYRFDDRAEVKKYALINVIPWSAIKPGGAYDSETKFAYVMDYLLKPGKTYNYKISTVFKRSDGRYLESYPAITSKSISMPNIPTVSIKAVSLPVGTSLTFVASPKNTTIPFDNYEIMRSSDNGRTYSKIWSAKREVNLNSQPTTFSLKELTYIDQKTISGRIYIYKARTSRWYVDNGGDGTAYSAFSKDSRITSVR